MLPNNTVNVIEHVFEDTCQNDFANSLQIRSASPLCGYALCNDGMCVSNVDLGMCEWELVNLLDCSHTEGDLGFSKVWLFAQWIHLQSTVCTSHHFVWWFFDYNYLLRLQFLIRGGYIMHFTIYTTVHIRKKNIVAVATRDLFGCVSIGNVYRYCGILRLKLRFKCSAWWWPNDRRELRRESSLSLK